MKLWPALTVPVRAERVLKEEAPEWVGAWWGSLCVGSLSEGCSSPISKEWECWWPEEKRQQIMQ